MQRNASFPRNFLLGCVVRPSSAYGKICIVPSSLPATLTHLSGKDLPLGTHLHIGLKLCILTRNSEILIKSDLLTSIKILTSFSSILY